VAYKWLINVIRWLDGFPPSFSANASILDLHLCSHNFSCPRGDLRPPCRLSAVEPATIAGSSLVHSALLTLGNLTDDAWVAGEHVPRVRVHIVRRRHELALVIAAAISNHDL